MYQEGGRVHRCRVGGYTGAGCVPGGKQNTQDDGLQCLMLVYTRGRYTTSCTVYQPTHVSHAGNHYRGPYSSWESKVTPPVGTRCSCVCVCLCWGSLTVVHLWECICEGWRSSCTGVSQQVFVPPHTTCHQRLTTSATGKFRPGITSR